ncbi:MAG: AAA family ATPase, partial [Trueperaceae bacterium]
MLLRTLGRLQLEGASFTQAKALTLLAYLALEGPQERRHLAELFWFKATDPLNNLNTALSRIRKGAPGAVEADEVRVSTRLPCDAVELLEANPKGEAETCLALYQGRFLQGVRLQGTSNDLEEWIYATRETLAARAREALLHLAEDSAAAGDFDRTADQAHRAYLLPGAPEPEAEDLERMYALLRAAEHPAATEVRKEAGGYGLNLRLSPSEARASLRLEAEPARREVSHNLPVQPTGFIGREAEMAKLDRLLADPECRLLTITGPGGVGKTRLAIEAVQHQGERYPDGVTFISFVTVTAPTSMPYPIATALDFSFFGPINPKEQLLEHLQDKEMLLVLDNLEHLLSGVHFIGEMLAT